MEQASHFIAVLSCLLFTGAAVYINLLEHPARMSCGTELAATVFAPSYKRAVPLQVSLALVATVAGLSSWLHSGEILWLAGSLLIFLVIPFTLLVIMPTNKALLAPELNRRSATSLLERWGKLHGCAASSLSSHRVCSWCSLSVLDVQFGKAGSMTAEEKMTIKSGLRSFS